MSAKKVSITTKPSNKTSPANADDWVNKNISTELQKEEAEKIKRLTIDIPESLHRTIKAQCANRGNKIVDEIRELLMDKYIPNNG